jgi:hypothetical protein
METRHIHDVIRDKRAMRVLTRPVCAISFALLLFAGVAFNPSTSSVARSQSSNIVPTVPRVISILEYTRQGAGTHLQLRRHVLVRNSVQIGLLASDLNRLHRFNAGPTWHCPIFRPGWYDVLSLSYANGAKQVIKVWTVCPPVAVVAGKTYGNFSGKPWVRLIHDINVALRGR